MAYSPNDHISKLLPEDELVALTDDEGLGVPDQARVDEAVELADAEIDSYCAVRYSVPISPVPALLRKLSVDMAVHTLYSRAVMSMPEVRSERFHAALKQLEAISRGTLTLGVGEARTTQGAETNRTTDSSVFARDKMEGF